MDTEAPLATRPLNHRKTVLWFLALSFSVTMNQGLGWEWGHQSSYYTLGPRPGAVLGPPSLFHMTPIQPTRNQTPYHMQIIGPAGAGRPAGLLLPGPKTKITPSSYGPHDPVPRSQPNLPSGRSEPTSWVHTLVVSPRHLLKFRAVYNPHATSSALPPVSLHSSDPIVLGTWPWSDSLGRGSLGSVYS